MHRSLVTRAARPAVALALLVLAVLLVGEAIPYFATVGNIRNVLIQAAIVAVVAYGMTLVILTGGIDLSVGGVMSLVGVIQAVLMTRDVAWPLAVLAGLAVGLALGLLNGAAVAALRLPPFIATFGTLGIASGLALFIADTTPVRALPPAFVAIGNDRLGDVPIVVMIAAVLLAALEAIMRTTRWGVRIRATGDAVAVARLSGVPVNRTLLTAYGASGLLAAGAGTLLAANLSTAGPLQGEPYTLSAIAACVIGGVDLMGGRGHLWAAALGTIFLAGVRNVLNLEGIAPFMQNFVIGCLIIVAVFATTRGAELRDRLMAPARRSGSELA